MSEIAKGIARIGFATTLPVIIGMAIAPAVWAADADNSSLAEVIITAQKRSSNLQKTPVSVTVVKGSELSEKGKSDLASILEEVPNVTMGSQGGSNTDSPASSVVIRGVQPAGTAGGASSSAPTTAVYTDGVFSGIGGDYDIARVEVLRGPQGTLYGRSATGGVVSIVTNDPKLNKFGSDFLVESGSSNLLHTTGNINVPVSDTVAIRLSANDLLKDGYYSGAGGRTHTTGVRGKVLIEPSSDLRILLSASTEERVANSGGDGFTATGPTSYTKSTGNSIGTNKYESNQYSAQVDWNMGWANLTYIGSFRNWTTSGETVIGPDIIHQFASYPMDDFTTHEIRLTSNESDKLKWLIGGFYYENKYENKQKNVWWHSQALTFEQNVNKRTKNIGLFGEATYSVTDATRVTGGLRFDKTRVQTYGYYTSNDAAAVGDPFSTTWFLPEVLNTATLSRDAGTLNYTNVTFKLRLEHDLTPVNSLYATVSTGFLPGDSQFTKNATGPVVAPYAQEKLTAYEVGSKNQFFDNRLNLNGDIFYYDYSGYQTTVNTSSNPQNPSYAIYTAPARMAGVEVEGRWKLTPEDQVNFSYAHINATYKNPSAEFSTYVAQSDIPGIAHDTATLGYSHDFNEVLGGTLKGQTDVRYVSAHDLGAMTAATYSTLAAWGRTPATTTLNGTLTWYSPDETFSVTLYGRNLTNVRERTSFSAQDYSINLTDGRSFGAVLQAHF